ncbi:hypothetical protein VitviT2T_014003 [Vitis vinifera]|uniref:Uncharacterized protein n=1 Tax=Vitis vinifera TaxID=29760 RepID=A0ABY9CIE8_VITVI|nr:hypothetical protein VitviT2T_014003 [Vitis vinifera]
MIALLRRPHPRQPRQPPKTGSRSTLSRIHLMNRVQTSVYQRATGIKTAKKDGGEEQGKTICASKPNIVREICKSMQFFVVSFLFFG